MSDSSAQGLEYPIRLRFNTKVLFAERLFAPENSLLADVISNSSKDPVRIAFIIDKGVADAWQELPGALQKYAAAHPLQIASDPNFLVIPGGEACKNSPDALIEILGHIHEARLCRQSCLIAIGGGAVLDVAGFAAAIFHRGIRLIRIPTTTLAQADSGIGVKNGINAFGQKNCLGTFRVPIAVLVDSAFLATLSQRDWMCGFSEAVKVALVREPDLFYQIARDADLIRNRDSAPALGVIRRSAELHLRHIAQSGDPFEMSHARPLDFGHWAAHKLEQLTNYRLRHGEAVAIGIALDSAYSMITGNLPEAEWEKIRDCLCALGFELFVPELQNCQLFDGLEEFREHLGGPLAIPMLSGIGKEFVAHEISLREMNRAIGVLAQTQTAAVRCT